MSTYYVDSAAGGGGNGSIGSPYNTVSAALTARWSEADVIISLKCGSLFREQATIPSSGTLGHIKTINSYSTGALPKIYGSSLLTSWSLDSGNIWKATLAATVTGAYFVETTAAISWGNYKTSKAGCVAEYDWYSDGSFVYIYSPSNPNTRYTGAEATRRDYGILSSTKNYISINNVEVAYTNLAGIMINLNSTYHTVDGATVHHIGAGKNGASGRGIWLGGSSYNTVQNCTVHDTSLSGIWLYSHSSYDTIGNIVQSCTVYDAYHSNIDIINATARTTSGNIFRYNLSYFTAGFDYANASSQNFYVSGESGHPVTNQEIYYNVSINTSLDHLLLYLNNVGTKVYNNTFYGHLVGSSAISCIRIAGAGNSGIDIRNNIGVDGGSGCINISTSSQVTTCDYNCWYQSAGGVTTVATVNATTYAMTQEANYHAATGWDAHKPTGGATFVNPVFISTS